MYRIMHVIRPAAGGMKNHLLAQLRYADRETFQLTVACPPEMVGVVEAMGVKVFSLPISPDTDLLTDRVVVKKLAVLLKQEKIDLLHAHGSRAGLLGRLAALLAGTPLRFFTAHNSIFYSGWPAWKQFSLVLAERVLAACSQQVIAVSENLRRELIEREKLPPHKVVCIHNGIEPGRFLEDQRRPDMKQDWGLSGASVVLGTVARLAPQKGLSTLLKAFALLYGQMAGENDLRLVLVGDGPLMSELRALAGELGIGERVIFTGMRRDIPQLMHCFDIFVLPSLTEGLPLTVLEAMAAGLVVVASRVGGIPEAVWDGQTGFLVPPGDEAALAEKLRYLVQQPELRCRMGEAGRMRVLEEFTAQSMVQKTEQLYFTWLKRFRKRLRSEGR
ncbi:glycosyltransferase family 4 protein [Desulfurispora thermophila]|uniref:glycosyltransferase family 4 protein n=1 Tax=Desulfurispora thermophila TaxID=265470 RepID=UPI00037857F1|nr:glycosyltransferase family 4 protein [Desulfurispora thermophila]